MRLLWLIDSLTLGGAEALAATFTIEARRRGIDVTIAVLKTIGGNPIESRLRDAGVDVVHLGSKNLRDVRAFRRLLALIRDERYDLVHSHLTYASIWGAVASARTSVPHVATLHTLPLKPGASAADRVRQRLLVSLLTRHAARVIAVSIAQRAAWIDVTSLPPGRVVVVPNGVAVSESNDAMFALAADQNFKTGDASSPFAGTDEHRRSGGAQSPLPAGGERVMVRGGCDSSPTNNLPSSGLRPPSPRERGEGQQEAHFPDENVRTDDAQSPLPAGGERGGCDSSLTNGHPSSGLRPPSPRERGEGQQEAHFPDENVRTDDAQSPLSAGGERVRVRGGSEDATEPRETHSGSRSTIGTIAALRRGKGLEVLLTAFRRVRNAAPGATLIVAGDGALRESLQRQAGELGIASSTEWLGYREDIDTVLAMLDVFVHPTFEDALPTAVLEAMAAGVPVVASAIGGVPEIVVDEVNGLLVPPGNIEALEAAILRLLRDPDLRKRLADAGRKTIEQRFSIETWIDSLLGVYRDVTGEPA